LKRTGEGEEAQIPTSLLAPCPFQKNVITKKEARD
jgi:hypothetical protein